MDTRQGCMVLTEQQRQALAEKLAGLREQRVARLASYAQRAQQDEPDVHAAQTAQVELAYLDQRIQQLEDTLSRAALVDAGGPPDVVRLGSRLTVRWDDGAEEDYVVVTPPELELRSGHISCESPVGRAVMGRRSGEMVELTTVGGVSRLLVLSVTAPTSGPMQRMSF